MALIYLEVRKAYPKFLDTVFFLCLVLSSTVSTGSVFPYICVLGTESVPRPVKKGLISVPKSQICREVLKSGGVTPGVKPG